MRVLLLCRYSRLGASSRLRSHQYLPLLRQAGFEVTVAPLFGDDYVADLFSGKLSKLAVLKSYFSRLRFILMARQFDLLWLEYEIFPWLPSWIELTLLPNGIPLVVDYDDAVYYYYDEHRFSFVRKLLSQKIDAVMRRADIVTAGNDYLAEHARHVGARRVMELPTVVDVTRYARGKETNSTTVTIGWIGQPSTVKYLEQLAPVLRKILYTHSVRLVAVGANQVQLRGLPIEIRPWSESTEASEIQQFDIGIMPLTDSSWERGKCGYKLIQYMACGKPVVASPVGANTKIVRHGVNGFLARTETEWCAAIGLLCEDAALRKRMGNEGLKTVEQHYSLQVTAPLLIELLRSTVKSEQQKGAI